MTACASTRTSPSGSWGESRAVKPAWAAWGSVMGLSSEEHRDGCSVLLLILGVGVGGKVQLRSMGDIFT